MYNNFDSNNLNNQPSQPNQPNQTPTPTPNQAPSTNQYNNPYTAQLRPTPPQPPIYQGEYVRYSDIAANQERQQKKSKKNSKGWFVGFGTLVVAFSFAASMLGSAAGNSISSSNSTQGSGVASSQEQGSGSATDTAKNDAGIINTATGSSSVMTVEQVATAASPSVVEITTESITTGNRMQQYVSTGAGSGVILSADGYIVTNDHVVSGASKLTVTTKDGTQYPATLVGTDKKTDIAVIKISATGLTAATVGTSASVKVGQDAIAIGNPLGQLGGTVTNGIISALDREITIDGTVMTLLQTNAAINPGNSGGGLFNNKGQLIGVVNAKSSGTDIEGIGFAIPIDTAMEIAKDLIDHGYVQDRVELGLTLLDVEDPMTAMMYSVNELGVYIYEIDTTSNAAVAGLQVGDRIVAVNGTEVANSTQMSAIVDKLKVGNSIKISVMRNGRAGDISFVLQSHAPGETA